MLATAKTALSWGRTCQDIGPIHHPDPQLDLRAARFSAFGLAPPSPHPVAGRRRLKEVLQTRNETTNR
jgi:hypothetical protein